MNLVEFFSKDEINELVLAPARVFNLIAEADDKIDKKEVKSFETILHNYKNFDSVLALECFGKISNLSSLMEMKTASNLDDRASLRYISALLDRKLEREIAVDYKITLVAVGYYIAYSSGSIFSHKVSDDENEVLNVISKDLDLSFRELINSHQIQKILDKIN